MNDRSKTCIKAILLLFFLLTLQPLYGYFNLNSFITNEIVNYFSSSIGSKVEVESVETSILRGRIEMKSLRISNPSDYYSSNACILGTIIVDIDLLSIFNSEITINDIIIQDFDINYENSSKGTNIQQINKHISEYALSPEISKRECKYIVKHLTIEDVSITLPPGITKNAIKIPPLNVEYSDIGEAKYGSQILEFIVAKLFKNIKDVMAENKVASCKITLPEPAYTEATM